MFATAAEALRHLDQHQIELVDLLYVDLFGGLHALTLPRAYISERTFVEGVGVDGSSIPGMGSLESGDRSVVPDPGTFFRYDRGPHRKLAVLCDIVEADTKAPARACPRSLARRAERLLSALGIASRSQWGPELEYYVFDKVEVDDRPERCGYRILSAEAGWGEGLSGPTLRHQGGYHVVPPADRLLALRDATVRRMEEAGIPVALHHHEVGAAGQVEIEIAFDGLLAAADHVTKGKFLARLCAAEAGLRATFMPKPLYGHAGTGMHFHQHLFDGDQPLFYQAGGYADLSPLALAYTAGLLDNGDALLAVTNPSTNSYRRLVPGFEAPVRAFFSLANRSAAVRVPRYARSPQDKRIEFRPPDGTSNPYLAMSAMLLAGVDGIRRSLDPQVLGLGPVDADPEHLPAAERDKLHLLPTSLTQALDALERRPDFLLQGGVFSRPLIEAWIQAGRAQVTELERRPHPLELARYLDC